MAGQIKDVTKCVDGREFAQFARDRDKKVKKQGSYFQVLGNDNNVVATVPDCGKPLSKPERSHLVLLFIKAGIVGLVLAAGGGYVYSVFAPYF